MQVNSVSRSNNPSFGTANFGTTAKAILNSSVKDSVIASRRLRFATDFADRNNKIDVHFLANDDNKTLFACFVDKKSKEIIKRRTENFFTRLVQGPADFVEKMIMKAAEMAEKMN
jgi:hypothetical protein